MTASSPKPSEDASRRPKVWAVGAGKGGAGKSVVATNLGVMLARRGKRCALIDADLGGANLHTLLGTPSPKRTLSGFLRRKYANLDEILCKTPVPGLFLVSGSGALMEMANPKHAQKEKILRHIFKLDVDHVIIDLGAGSSFNVLDFFLAADRGLVVVVPEPTSIENAYHFLKAAFFRKLKRATHLPGVKPALDLALDRPADGTIQSAKGLLAAVRRIEPAAADALEEEAAGFAPQIIVNRARGENDERLGPDMRTACRDYFGSKVEFLGHLPDDDLVRTSVQSRLPVVEAFPTSPFGLKLGEIASYLHRTEDLQDGDAA